MTSVFRISPPLLRFQFYRLDSRRERRTEVQTVQADFQFYRLDSQKCASISPLEIGAAFNSIV